MMKLISYRTYTSWLYVFIFLHVTLWTVSPAWVRYALPMDAIEGAIWGRQLEWGYDKNPFMNGWLTELAIQLGGQNGWMVYLFSQLSVALCFWATWQLSKKILPPLYALLSVLLLEGVQYYNLHAIDFNDNTLELGLWALSILFFYQALRQKTRCDWILTGLFAGLSLMTKYFTTMLLVPMMLFMLVNQEARQSFKNRDFYLGIGIFLSIITPHIIWLFHHDFITLTYAFQRVSSPPTWLNHVFYPLQFAWQIIETFLPALVLLSILFLGKNSPALEHAPQAFSSFNKQFLFFVGLGPFLLIVILSTLFGMKLRAGWGQPLLSLWGIIFLACLKPQVTAAKFFRFIGILLCVMTTTALIYCAALIRANEPSSANFPGKKIAAQLTQQWHETYHTSLKYVVGSRWIAGNIALYSQDRPQVYMDSNPKMSPWISEEKLKKEGALFVWDFSEDTEVPISKIQNRFKRLGNTTVISFFWMRNPSMRPIQVTYAFLPPEGSVLLK